MDCTFQDNTQNILDMNKRPMIDENTNTKQLNIKDNKWWTTR